LSDGRSAVLWLKAGTRLVVWQFGTIDSDMSGFATIEAEFVIDAILPLFWGESATSASMFSSLVLPKRRRLWYSVDLRFFFQDFLNMWVLLSEAPSRASKGTPVSIEFSGFLNKSGQCIWHRRYLE